MTARPPNILIVMADQMAPAFLPVYGHALARAPNMEAVAREGVVFDSAYCGSPLCSPSRASFMTGLLPSRNRVYDNAAEFSADIPTFAHHLRLLGYRTILSGKMHFCGPDQLHGFESRLTTDIYPADYGWTPDWDHPDVRPSWYHNMSSVAQAGVCPSPIRTTHSPCRSDTGASIATRTSSCPRRPPPPGRSIRTRAGCAASARWTPSR
jgi:choline-sulfatase